MTDAIAGRVVVVTGATGDAGRAVCTRLVEAGARVVAVGTDAGRLASVPAEARFVADLSDPDAARALASRVASEVGPTDGLVHLVGGWRLGNDEAAWNDLEPRLLGTLRHATLAFHDQLTSSEAGRLAIVGSTAAERPTWSGAAYGVLKAAAASWMSAVASGWRKAGRAAAVTYVVRSLGEGGTPHSELADAVVRLWDTPATESNGRSIPLVTDH